MTRRYQLDEPKPRKRPAGKPTGEGQLISGWNFRVWWKRSGMKRAKIKHFFTFKPALNLYLQLSHEEPWRFWNMPWNAEPLTGDEPHCGSERWFGRCSPPCSFTLREFIKERRARYGRLIDIRLERQPTGAWESLEDPSEWETSSTRNGLQRKPRAAYPAERWANRDRMLLPAPFDPAGWVKPIADDLF